MTKFFIPLIIAMSLSLGGCIFDPYWNHHDWGWYHGWDHDGDWDHHGGGHHDD